MVKKVIDTSLNLKGKEDIRSHFNFIRQAFLDWNYMRPDEDGFEKQKTKLLNLVKQHEHAPENV
jgi:V/A-type H+-transporting ATPase subunit A